MKFATLACLSALCLHATLAQSAPGEPASAEPAKSEQGSAAPKVTTPRSEPAVPRGETRAEAARTEKAGAAPVVSAPVVSGRDRRRPSYAACNRASHQRGYRGGRRRRFLIRCRLGYERARPAQHQAPAPATPVRKP